MLVARRYNFLSVKKRSNCKTVPTFLSMIVDCVAGVERGKGNSEGLRKTL